MKIAGGCFGCLGFVFLILMVAWGFITAAVGNLLATQAPDVWMAVGPFFGMGQWVNGTCCCLSSAVAIALFAFSSSRGREGIE